MSTVRQLKHDVEKLSRHELAAFREWFTEFVADAWDKQLKQDVAAGRLNVLAEEALRDLRAGCCTKL